jgi:hypothetical protein
LTDEQQMAIAKLKRYTDFNDLMTNSVFGPDALEHQVTTQVNNVIKGQKEQFEVQHKQEQKPFVKFAQQHQLNAIKI